MIIGKITNKHNIIINKKKDRKNNNDVNNYNNNKVFNDKTIDNSDVGRIINNNNSNSTNGDLKSE